MLFIVIDRVKLEFVKPDIALAQTSMLKQTFQMYEDLKKQNKLKFAYAFADIPGGISLWDVESNDELQRILFLLPSMPLVERTVRPLTELKSISNVIGELESVLSSMPKEFDMSK